MYWQGLRFKTPRPFAGAGDIVRGGLSPSVGAFRIHPGNRALLGLALDLFEIALRADGSADAPPRCDMFIMRALDSALHRRFSTGVSRAK